MKHTAPGGDMLLRDLARPSEVASSGFWGTGRLVADGVVIKIPVNYQSLGIQSTCKSVYC